MDIKIHDFSAREPRFTRKSCIMWIDVLDVKKHESESLLVSRSVCCLHHRPLSFGLLSFLWSSVLTVSIYDSYLMFLSCGRTMSGMKVKLHPRQFHVFWAIRAFLRWKYLGNKRRQHAEYLCNSTWTPKGVLRKCLIRQIKWKQLWLRT